MSSSKMYTQEQLEIELLKNNQSHIFKVLDRIDQKVDSHFHWTLGLILGMYAIGLTGLIAAIGHSYNWF
jgi:hypothetical protein